MSDGEYSSDFIPFEKIEMDITRGGPPRGTLPIHLEGLTPNSRECLKLSVPDHLTVGNVRDRARAAANNHGMKVKTRVIKGEVYVWRVA